MDTSHHKAKPTHIASNGAIVPSELTSKAYRQNILIHDPATGGTTDAGMSIRSAYFSICVTHTALAVPGTLVWSHAHGVASVWVTGVRHTTVDLYALIPSACWGNKRYREFTRVLLPTLCHYLMQELAVGVLREGDTQAVVEEVFGHIISYRDIGLSIERTAYVLNECEALTLPMLLRALYCVALHVRSGHPLFSHTNF